MFGPTILCFPDLNKKACDPYLSRREIGQLGENCSNPQAFDNLCELVCRDQTRVVNAINHLAHRGTSLIRNCLLLGAYSRTMPRALR